MFEISAVSDCANGENGRIKLYYFYPNASKAFNDGYERNFCGIEFGYENNNKTSKVITFTTKDTDTKISLSELPHLSRITGKLISNET
jgi:hypothetical protein